MLDVRDGEGGGVGREDGWGLGHDVEHSHTGRGSHMELEELHKVEGLECSRTEGQD